MQTKPGAPITIRINANGRTLTDDWVKMANLRDVNFSRIIIGNRVSSIIVPPAKPNINLSKIIQIAGKKYESFDINFTDENISSTYEVIVASRPTIQEFVSLLNNKSESGPWPYSYRRFLRGTALNIGKGLFSQRLFSALGLSYPNIRPFSYIEFNLPVSRGKYIFVWTNGGQVGTNTNQNNALGVLNNSPWMDYGDERIGDTVAHEVGHRFELEHDSAILGGQKFEYYDGWNHSFKWAPIMGAQPLYRAPISLTQWSEGEYIGATNNENDIIKLGNNISYIKKPKNSLSKVSQNDFENFERFSNGECWDKISSDGYNVRTINRSDVKTNADNKKVIEGMIGFPGDFEILKMVLPKGDYSFTIDSITKSNQGSMLDPEIQILNCNCQRSKEKHPVGCNSSNLPTIYPENVSNKVQCISFTNCLSDSYTTSKKTPSNSDGFSIVTASLQLNYTSIVYLLIKGGQETPMDEGWSNYSSIGKYFLEIKKDGSNSPDSFLGSEILPKCRCEEFDFCKNNSTEKVLLYVQDQGDEIGTTNKTEAHIEEFSSVIDGEAKTKKFLVYGEPIPVDAQEDPNKFYLNVVIDGQCKKQEFVVGSEWEKKQGI